MKSKIFTTALSICLATAAFSQETAPKNPLTFSGYAETYFQYDTNNPETNTRPGFVYSHNRNNEVSLNLALLKANYDSDNVRANLSLYWVLRHNWHSYTNQLLRTN